MSSPDAIVPTPWDERVLGIPTYEIREPTRDALTRAAKTPGHYTVKVDPLESKKLLHEFGFYYCDTLIEPFCPSERFIPHTRNEVSFSRDVDIERVSALAGGAFTHDRFHRDFNVERQMADRRYELWLRDILATGTVLSLRHREDFAGFFAFKEHRILLHALDARYRGKGLAKAFWSAACDEMFGLGHTEIASSISASNVSVTNVYTALGFRMRNPRDIYHLLTG